MDMLSMWINLYLNAYKKGENQDILDTIDKSIDSLIKEKGIDYVIF